MNAPVQNKINLLQLLQEHRSEILVFGVERIGLFGSFVRNQAHEKSDIDFVVEFKQGQKNYDNFIGLAYYLEDLLGRKIELLTPKSMSPYIGPEIMKEVEYVIAA
ncbi:MAG: nucleotidyltransferase family protein [Vicingaceae bacterium]|nr:nucleotidyltransferase family protein [Vicingaceae bacterium]